MRILGGLLRWSARTPGGGAPALSGTYVVERAGNRYDVRLEGGEEAFSDRVFDRPAAAQSLLEHVAGHPVDPGLAGYFAAEQLLSSRSEVSAEETQQWLRSGRSWMTTSAPEQEPPSDPRRPVVAAGEREAALSRATANRGADRAGHPSPRRIAAPVSATRSRPALEAPPSGRSSARGGGGDALASPMRARKEERSPNPLRTLAPLALGACAIALLAILLSGGGPDRAGPKTTNVPAGGPRVPGPPRRPGQGGEAGGLYTVKSGDTPGAIAEKTKISLERLQELNPGLDSQGLVSGQKLKLRR